MIKLCCICISQGIILSCVVSIVLGQYFVASAFSFESLYMTLAMGSRQGTMQDLHDMQLGNA